MIVPLHIEQFGEGVPLILGHGFAGSARNFRPQARALRAGAQVILFDARGHARSAAPDVAAEYAPERFVADVLGIADQFGHQRFFVGGLSMGAGVALRVALAHPERVLGLVLASFPRTREDAANTSWANSFAQAITDEGLERAGERFVWGARSRFDPSGAKLIRQGFLEHHGYALAHVLRELLARQPAIAELAPRLAKLEVPALVVAASDDDLSLSASKQLVATLPCAELKIFENAGHVLNLTRPGEFNQLVSEFLARPGSSKTERLGQVS